MDDKAIMQMSDFVRDNLSLKLNAKPTKRVSLDFQARWSKTKINGGGANRPMWPLALVPCCTPPLRDSCLRVLTSGC